MGVILDFREEVFLSLVYIERECCRLPVCVKSEREHYQYQVVVEQESGEYMSYNSQELKFRRLEDLLRQLPIFQQTIDGVHKTSISTHHKDGLLFAPESNWQEFSPCKVYD